MATNKERRVMAELMRDPAFRDAWENLRGAVSRIDPGSLDDPEAVISTIRAAMGSVEAVLDDRPELAALVEAAESEKH